MSRVFIWGNSTWWRWFSRWSTVRPAAPWVYSGSLQAPAPGSGSRGRGRSPPAAAASWCRGSAVPRSPSGTSLRPCCVHLAPASPSWTCWTTDSLLIQTDEANFPVSMSPNVPAFFGAVRPWGWACGCVCLSVYRLLCVCDRCCCAHLGGTALPPVTQHGNKHTRTENRLYFIIWTFSGPWVCEGSELTKFWMKINLYWQNHIITS